MLIITGTGRCGTSALAGFIYRAVNCNASKEKLHWIEGVRGGYESPTVTNINDALRKGKGLHKSKILKVDLEWVKDPRFTMDGVLKKWLDLRSDLKFILTVRDVDSTIKAYRRHPKHFVETAMLTDNELKNHIESRIEKFLLLSSEYGFEYKILNFPQYINQADKVIDILSDFGGLNINKDYGKRIWTKWIDENKVHYK